MVKEVRMFQLIRLGRPFLANCSRSTFKCGDGEAGVSNGISTKAAAYFFSYDSGQNLRWTGLISPSHIYTTLVNQARCTTLSTLNWINIRNFQYKTDLFSSHFSFPSIFNGHNKTKIEYSIQNGPMKYYRGASSSYRKWRRRKEHKRENEFFFNLFLP